MAVDGFNNVSLNHYRDELIIADNGVFPVRIIDLKDTFEYSNGGVVFTQPKDWNFHTISHTWSTELRQMSVEVGKKVMAFEQRYNEFFRHGNFNKWPAYTHLLEFLKILQSDGVERVWFDALCINQVNDKERSHEIDHMGAFYCHSLGCYVAPHGLGKAGVGIPEDDHQFMPRWFSRVWTSQEFLLPKRLNFVVEMSSSQFHKVLSVVKRLLVKGACHCKGKGRSSMWPWGSVKARDPIDFNEFNELGQRFEENPNDDTGSELLSACDSKIPREMLLHTISQVAKNALDHGVWEKIIKKVVEKREHILRSEEEMSLRAVEGGDESEFWRVLESADCSCTHGRLKRVEAVRVGEKDEEKRMYLIDRDAYVYIMTQLGDVNLWHALCDADTFLVSA